MHSVCFLFQARQTSEDKLQQWTTVMPAVGFCTRSLLITEGYHAMASSGLVLSSVTRVQNSWQGPGPLVLWAHGTQKWQYMLQACKYSFVGCTVAPGFDFADFELGDRATLLSSFPQHREIIQRLTRDPQQASV